MSKLAFEARSASHQGATLCTHHPP